MEKDQIGDRIKRFRKSKGWTARELCRRIGISPSSMSEIENNKTRPSVIMLEYMIRNTDVNVSWILTGEGDMIRSEISSSKSEDIYSDNPNKNKILPNNLKAREDEKKKLIEELKEVFVAKEDIISSEKLDSLKEFGLDSGRDAEEFEWYSRRFGIPNEPLAA